MRTLPSDAGAVSAVLGVGAAGIVGGAHTSGCAFRKAVASAAVKLVPPALGLVTARPWAPTMRQHPSICAFSMA
jgi:hypothetical protein